MPPSYVKTIRGEILYEYAKLISRSAYGTLQRGFFQILFDEPAVRRRLYGLTLWTVRNRSKVQPRIETILAKVKPFRLRRKRMASLCLFLVLTIIILGVQVYSLFSPFLTGVLLLLAGLFSWRNYRILNRFGWV